MAMLPVAIQIEAVRAAAIHNGMPPILGQPLRYFVEHAAEEVDRLRRTFDLTAYEAQNVLRALLVVATLGPGKKSFSAVKASRRAELLEDARLRGFREAAKQAWHFIDPALKLRKRWSYIGQIDFFVRELKRTRLGKLHCVLKAELGLDLPGPAPQTPAQP